MRSPHPSLDFLARRQLVTHFEYIAIALSLVFSFTSLRLVGGLAHALDQASRYWVHASLSIATLFMVTIVFWAFWSMRVVDWTYPKFILALSGPGALFYVATTLVPNDPSTIKSWREYYFSVRTRVFLGLGAWALLTAISSTLLLEMPLRHPARAGQLMLLTISVVGMASQSPRVHAGLALTWLAGIVVFGLSIFVSPDALS